MKKLFLSLSMFLMASAFLMAQQSGKKVIITKKTVDADGVEQVEKIVLTGEDAEDFDINDYLPEEGDKSEVDIDVRIEAVENLPADAKSPKKEVRIMKIERETELGDAKEKNIEVITDDESGEIRIIVDGEEEKIINLNDMVKDLEDINIDIEGGETKIFKIDAGDLEGIGNGTNTRMIIINTDEGELPEDIDGILESSGFNWQEKDGNRFFIQKESCDANPNKALLGVWPGNDNEKGVEIGGVVEGSGAEKAGLKEGDIVTAIEGKPIKTFADLSAAIGAKQPGDEIKVEYLRDNAPKTVTAILGKQEERAFQFNMEVEDADGETHGMHRFFRSSDECCANSQTEEKPYIGIMIQDTGEGVDVIEVNRGDDVLQVGDVITKFGKVEIADMDELINAVSPYKPGDKVKVRYIRDGKKGKGTVTLLGRTVKSCCHAEGPKQKIIRKERIIIRNGEEEGQAPEIKSDLGNARLSLQGLELFPNPSDGVFQLQFESGEEGPVTISITDATGKEVVRDEIADFKGSYAGEFDLKGNTPGIYFLNISQNGKVTTQKIILNGQK